MSKEIIRFKTHDNSALHASTPSLSEEKGVFMSTYGCQMNDNDSERMLSLLEQMNYTQVNTPELASLIIINSCSIREKPVHKVHSEVGRYRKLKLTKPNLKVGVAGCVAQQEKDRLLKDLPTLDFVLGPDNIDSLPEVILSLKDEDDEDDKDVRLNAAKFKHQEPYHVDTLVRNPGVSTFINITKGCDNFCTFCVVPYTRGRERSRPVTHLIDDINTLVKRGVKEVTLLGQNVNSYTCETGLGFSDLLKNICEKTDIQRVRYTTSHPKDFTDDLIEISKEYKEKICEHIHLPVQSGSTKVLERMNRGYSREHYLKITEKIFKELPNVALTTDIIVGFPGETEDQFNETMTLLDEVPYENIFAFTYSPRPFTKAARFDDQIEEPVQKERLQRLFDKHETQAWEFCKRYQDKKIKVLVEKQDKKTGSYRGRNVQNKMTHFMPFNASEENGELVGKTVEVEVYKTFPLTLRANRLEGLS